MVANGYPPFHSFHYRAEGHAFSGHLERPAKHLIEAQASTCLPLTGGQGRAHVEGFAINQLVSFRKGYSHVSGSKSTDGTHTSHSTSVVEGLNVLDVVTADRVVARLTSEHAPKEKEGHIIALGSKFENFRIAGCPVEVEFDHELFLNHKTFDTLSKKLASPKKPGKRSDESGGVILCTFVKTLKVDCPGVEVNGHVITVPHFGKIYVGEVLVEPRFKRLSMLHLQLGSPQEGLLNVTEACINGTHFP
jgi:hypothetical protein